MTINEALPKLLRAMAEGRDDQEYMILIDAADELETWRGLAVAAADKLIQQQRKAHQPRRASYA